VRDIAIRVNNVKKAFKLPHERHSTLKSLIINPFRQKKTFVRQEVLKDVSFEIKKGEFFGIVGRNGGGKSTLLKLLAGIYMPDNGNIEVSGKLVPFIELGVGFNPELTGRDNVYLNGALLGFSDKEIDAIYEDIVSFAELEDFMDQKLKNYSSGMQVRLAFSVATRSQADILLVDEVLAVGDVSFQRKCYDYFSSLKKTGKTVIFISHDMDAVRQYCDRAILIEKGEVVFNGSASAVAEQYTKLFNAAPADLAVNLSPNSERWGDQSVEISVDPPKISQKSITLGVSITAKKDVKDQVVGLSIKDANSNIVFGTNTQLLKEPLPDMNKGEVKKLSWEIPNILKDGNYTIDVASHGYGGLPVYDWWNDAFSFAVQLNRKSPYAIAPDVKLTISK
jgi:ABC-2 type transport system ATP-binding protein